MRRHNCLLLAGSALVLLLGNAACADDFRTGKDAQQEMVIGAYDSHGTGNQTRVREYDGRSFPGIGLESLSFYGYDAATQFRVDAQDLIVGADESINFMFANRNLFSIRGGTNMLTHRLVAIPAINPWVARQLALITDPVPTAAVIGTSGDTFIDLNPGTNYLMNRRVNNLDFYLNADQRQRVGIVASWWQEYEEGQQQQLFRAGAAGPGIANRQRGSVALPVNRETNEASIGADVAVGESAVVNVKFQNTTFTDHRANPATGSTLDFKPLNTITKISNDNHSAKISARADITDKLQFTGVQINRTRTNNSNDVPTGKYDSNHATGTAMSKKVKTNSTNLSLTYRPIDSLSFMGRWKHLGIDNQVPVIYSTAALTDTTVTNKQLNGNTQSLEFESVFTGLAHTYLRVNYEKEQTDREDGTLQAGSATSLASPFTGSSIDWNIFRTAVRYYPTLRLNISGNYENWSADKGGFTGAPNSRQKTSVNATYMLCDNAAIYGDISQWKESNDQIDVASVPNPSTNATEAAERADAAGLNLDNTYRTTSVGTWFAVSDRLTLDANYGYVVADSTNLWIIGNPSTTPSTTSEYTGNVPYKSNDTQWSTNATYVINKKWQCHGGFLHSNSNGATFVDSAQFAGFGPEWNPFHVKQNRWSIGCNYGMSKKDKLCFDYSVSKWTDEVDAGQTGAYQVYRLTWNRVF